MDPDLKASGSQPQIAAISSKPDICSRVALIAFRSALVSLGLGLLVGFFAVRAMGLWQLGGDKDPSAETLARFAVVCLLSAPVLNATAFVASLWGCWRGKSQPNSILWLSGLGVLAIGLFLLIANQ